MATFSLKRKQFGKFSEFVKRSGKEITDAKIISNKTPGNIVSRAWKSGASGKAKVLGAAAIFRNCRIINCIFIRKKIKRRWQEKLITISNIWIIGELLFKLRM